MHMEIVKSGFTLLFNLNLVCSQSLQSLKAKIDPQEIVCKVRAEGWLCTKKRKY